MGRGGAGQGRAACQRGAGESAPSRGGLECCAHGAACSCRCRRPDSSSCGSACLHGGEAPLGVGAFRVLAVPANHAGLPCREASSNQHTSMRQ